jgi:SRSO17 transposase
MVKSPQGNLTWIRKGGCPYWTRHYTFWLSNAPSDTSLVDLAVVALSRHPIEKLLEEAKGDVGMADYDVRHWHGWHRHMTLVMMAHAWLKLLQHDQREKKSPTYLVELQPA